MFTECARFSHIISTADASYLNEIIALIGRKNYVMSTSWNPKPSVWLVVCGCGADFLWPEFLQVLDAPAGDGFGIGIVFEDFDA